MQKLFIGNHEFNVKDYYCSQDGMYLPKQDGKLWLYINITDVCNGRCPFCINPGKKSGKSMLDLSKLRSVLDVIESKIYGISITGGEPFLDVELLDSVMDVIIDVMGHRVEIDTVTNGVNFREILHLRHLDDFDSIHLSRHDVSDLDNNKLFGFETVTADQIKETMLQLSDPGKIVFNCTLQRGHVDTIEKVSEYLDMAAEIGVENTSFIGLSRCNRYCNEHFVDPAGIDFRSDDRFRVWNHFQDYEYCSCSSGDYAAQSRWVRFYYRCVGKECAPFARQLVYTADNRLRAGFSGDEIQVFSNGKGTE